MLPSILLLPPELPLGMRCKKDCEQPFREHIIFGLWEG
jgi:hypothetical protein